MVDASDRGNDLNTLLKWGLPRVVNESDSFPYTFVAPQIPEEQTWVVRAADVVALLDELIAANSIDPARVIVAGFSLGSLCGCSSSIWARTPEFKCKPTRRPQIYSPSDFPRWEGC
jgi:predicted peptidase